MTEFPEPRGDESDAGVLFARYLEFYRETALRKVRSLTAADQRASRLPSGWAPLELLNHLFFMERRWFVWGFLGEDVEDVWGEDGGDRWQVPDDVSVDQLAGRIRGLGRQVSDLLTTRPLDEVAPAGPRFDDEPPSLAWICFHVLQEYARHAGHLDVAVELAGGELGE
jgi:hypothetical protein